MSKKLNTIIEKHSAKDWRALLVEFLTSDEAKTFYRRFAWNALYAVISVCIGAANYVATQNPEYSMLITMALMPTLNSISKQVHNHLNKNRK